MAETVGVVAAGIAFGEVVIKISSHVFTLKHMWKEFKEMPDSIKQLVEDIEMLGSVLQEMETDMTSSTADGTVWGGGVGSLIVEACRRALNTLSLSVNDVSQEMRASSGIKAALRKGKMVLNKEFWVKTERRLQNVVGRLQIAQHWWLIALSKQQFDLMGCRLQPARIEPQPLHGEAPSETQEQTHNVPNQRHRTYTSNEPGDRRQYELTQEHLGQTLIGSMAVERARSSAGSMNGSRCDKYYIQVKPPNWITQKAWSIVFSISSGGFNLNLRVYSVVPFNSLVLNYARRGDIKSMLGLFDQNLASPFDVCKHGQGLLHYAIRGSCDTRAIATMVDWGLDLTRCLDPRERSSSWTISMLMQDFSKYRSVHEFVVAKNLVEDITDCWLLPNYTSKQRGWQSVVSNASWCSGSLRLFIPRFRPGHYRMHVLDRLRLATEFSVGHADDLRYLLWIDGKVQKEDIKTLDEMGFPLVNFIASNYTQERALNPEAMPRRVAIEALHQTDSDALSLRQYTRGFSQWRRKVGLSLQNWLEDLQRGGVDLKNYGQEEEKIFRQLNIFRSKAFEAESWPLGSSPVTYALIGFNHGPEPKDWELEWELDTDELLGEFWEHIENQDIRMVGAWVD
ncbi:hypothetical protein BBAD15_g9164 [Beauveria bassiana D1-5]|uniref:Fungal N-terminal domain-containing protein n=1 Tax=Beauveria bassiana D1-5 TaxID=1245745 RepID=A0A0A2VCD6_BEABA|nr:hypothetical protein BBAD15_g9164 [Beauveria bassiana D1-5]